MKIKSNKTLIGVLSIVVPLTAAAANDRWYGYAGLQRHDLKMNVSHTTGLSTSDKGLHAGIGYQLSDNFSVEGGYMDMNRLIGSNNGAWAVDSSESASYAKNTYSYTSDLAGSLNINSEVDGWTLGGVYSAPLAEKFEGFVRAGVYRWSADTAVSGVITAGTLTINSQDYTGAYDTYASTSGADAYLGLGGVYHASDNVGIKFGYNKYKIDTNKVDSSELSLVFKL